MKLLTGNSNKNLSIKISKFLKNKIVNSSIRKFSDGEIYVEIKLADGKKCERCWAVLQEVSSSKNNLCNRCDDVWKTFQK